MAAKRSGHEEEAVSLMVGMLRLDRNSRSAKLPSVKTVGCAPQKVDLQIPLDAEGPELPSKSHVAAPLKHAIILGALRKLRYDRDSARVRFRPERSLARIRRLPGGGEGGMPSPAYALVLVENEETVGQRYDFWADDTGVQYQFPNMYRKRVTEGRPFVYYRGVRRAGGKRGAAEYLRIS